jgi:hypothetical protein
MLPVVRDPSPKERDNRRKAKRWRIADFSGSHTRAVHRMTLASVLPTNQYLVIHDWIGQIGRHFDFRQVLGLGGAWYNP